MSAPEEYPWRVGKSRSPLDNIPRFLRDIPRWCLWRHDAKRGKVPFGSTADPKSQKAFDIVVIAFDGAPDKAALGVGFIMTDGVSTLEGWLTNLDIDACRDPFTGEVAPWAQAIVDYYQSYTEITPSGTGLRTWFLTPNKPPRVPIVFIPDVESTTTTGKRPQIQLFGSGAASFVTVTGVLYDPTLTKIVLVDELDPIIRNAAAKEESRIQSVAMTGAPVTLESITESILKDPQGKKLFRGTWQGEFPSASEGFGQLTRLALAASNNDVEQTIEFLLSSAYGKGHVESRDPRRYTQREWISRDILRIYNREHGRLVEAFSPLPVEPKPEIPEDTWILQLDDYVRTIRPPEFLIHNLIPASGFIQIFGEPSAGKTPVALSLALAVAIGEDDWSGRSILDCGPVVYMVGEDSSGMRDRVIAQLHEFKCVKPMKDIPFYLTTRPGELVEPENAGEWIAKIKSSLKGKPKLLVVDTLNRNFGPGNENEIEAMSQYIANIYTISQALECAVVVVHHTGHQNKERARGSSALYAALDVEIQVKRADRDLVISFTKTKHFETPPPITAAIIPHVVGEDSRGSERTAVALQTRNLDTNLMVNPQTIIGGKYVADILYTLEPHFGAPMSFGEVAQILGWESPEFAKKALKQITGYNLLTIKRIRNGGTTFKLLATDLGAIMLL